MIKRYTPVIDYDKVDDVEFAIMQEDKEGKWVSLDDYMEIASQLEFLEEMGGDE